MNSEVAVALTQISTLRKRLTYAGYASLLVTNYYAYILAYSSLNVLSNIYNNSQSENDIPVWYEVLAYTYVVPSAVANFICDVLSIDLVAFAKKFSEGSEENSDEYNKLTWFAIITGHLAFFIGSLYPVIALSLLTDSKPIVYGIGFFSCIFSYFFFLLLSHNDLIKHAKFFSQSSLRGVINSIKINPSGVFEMIFQLLNNSFYRSVAIGFFTVRLLKFESAGHNQLNLALIILSMVLVFLQTVFTRFIPLHEKYLANSDGTNRSGKISLKEVLLNSIRAFGIIYITYRLCEGKNILAFTTLPIMTTLFAIQGYVSAKKQGSQINPQTSAVNQSSAKSLFICNFLARSLRVLAISFFVLEVSQFIRNQGYNINISLIDAIMMSFANISIEASNFLYYKSKMPRVLKNWFNLFATEKDYSRAINQGGISLTRLMTRQEEEYPSDFRTHASTPLVL